MTTRTHLRYDFTFEPYLVEPGWWKLAGFDIVEDGAYWVLKQTGAKYRSRDGAYTDIRVIYYSLVLTCENIENKRRSKHIKS